MKKQFGLMGIILLVSILDIGANKPVVKWSHDSKGYGFIEPDSYDLEESPKYNFYPGRYRGSKGVSAKKTSRKNNVQENNKTIPMAYRRT